MRRLRILLVEDDAIISQLIAEILAELGHDVCDTVRTEIEAIDAAERHAPDLMVVDAYLQPGSGVSAMDTILRRTPMPHIFMTGGDRRIMPPRATVLLKPFGVAGLTAALESVAGSIETTARGSAHGQP